MMEKKIRLKSLMDAYAFVRDASRCDYDVDIGHGHKHVDAKSLLGVLGLDLTKPLTVHCSKEMDPVFFCALRRFAV
jgi:hypothetical protein